jgi:SAM-dependent methyltransferase
VSSPRHSTPTRLPLNLAASHTTEWVRRADTTQADSAADVGSAAANFESSERQRHLRALLAAHQLLPLTRKTILELGCGTGRWLRDLIALGADPANLHGVELLEATAARARRLCPSQVTIECGNAAQLRSAPDAFDIVLQAGLFSSIFDDAVKHAIATEILRVLRPGGIVLWYDVCLKNPQNPYVQPITGAEICRLFPACPVELQRVGLATPLLRLLAPRSPRVCAVLSRVPVLCTHLFGVVHKPATLQ